MLMMIIGMSLLYAYVMSYLHISQAAAGIVSACICPNGCCSLVILGFVMLLGFFLPPVSIILMTAPIILPPLQAAGFDLVWFGVIMTIVMEMGLIHPPVGSQYVRHQQHRARHLLVRNHLGHLAVSGLDAGRGSALLLVSWHRDLASNHCYEVKRCQHLTVCFDASRQCCRRPDAPVEPWTGANGSGGWLAV